MLITHEIDLDLIKQDAAPRVQVKQGDVLTRNIRICLYINGKAWDIPAIASAVIRYRAWDAESLTCTHGMYESMEDGSPAVLITGNALEIMPCQEMMARPGLVAVDVLLASGERKLATFQFEMCVHPSLG